MANSKEPLSKRLKQAVDECQDLLADLPASQELTDSSEPIPSLLDQVREYLADEERDQTPPIAILHHFACAGGTLISRCLSVMPQVYLLSEVDPLSTHGLDMNRPVFAPTDVLRHLRYSHRPVPDDVIVDAYLEGLVTVVGRVRETGGRLVIRDHSHSHFCTDVDPASRPSHLAILKRRFSVRNVVTVRDPVESYLSLIALKWVSFEPASFDEYCRRQLLFLDACGDCDIVRYEDFVRDPESVLEDLCRVLGLVYRPGAPDLISTIRLTGDSGRKGTQIAPREPKPVPDAIALEIERSDHYNALKVRLKY